MYDEVMSTATFTDLLRKPKEVLALINAGQVRITRRDGDDLVILRGHDLAILEEGAALSSQLIRAIGRNKNNVVLALTDLFGWTGELSAQELNSYASEIEQLLYTASELGTFERLLRAQQEWKETALAYAMGLRPSQPVELPDTAVRVDRP